MQVDGNSRDSASQGEEVTKPRASASLILLRDSPAGPEVLLVQRNPELRFMGGAWVFPGGATHAEDRDERATARRELEEEAGIGLPGDAELVRYSRWITPAELSRRFDTHFFVAEAPERTEAAIDGVECVDVRWIRPQAALDAGARGELMLVVPTIKHLEQLAGHESVAEALATARARKVASVQPRVLVEGGVARVLLPGDPGYAA
ncbi:MAG: NUDIX domain-containing protein [Thermoleophilaceae bacterium]|nr:NUDIX domain-containing protein [Thermoleophilaceae bacterium]